MKRMCVLRGLVLATLAIGLGLVSGCALLGGGLTVVITATPVSGTVPLAVAFHASDSTGIGDDATFAWSFDDGTPAHEGAVGDHTYRDAGTYTLTLTVHSGGSVATASATIMVEPAVWITDKNLGKVFKLSLTGETLAELQVPSTQPTGVTLVETGENLRLYVACEGDGRQKIWQIDPAGVVESVEFSAQGQLPRNLTHAAGSPQRIWHTDGLARRFYGLNMTDLQRSESFGNTYFPDVDFLHTPVGLSWTPEAGEAGYLWYLEGDTGLLYQLEIIPPVDIFSGIQLDLVGDPLEIQVESVSAMDWLDGYLWAVDVDRHEIVQVDPATGEPTGLKVTGFPGASPAGLEFQE